MWRFFKQFAAVCGGLAIGLLLTLAAFGAWGLPGACGVIVVIGAAWGGFRWHLRRTQRAIRERWARLSDAQRLHAMAALSAEDRAEVLAAFNENAARRRS